MSVLQRATLSVLTCLSYSSPPCLSSSPAVLLYLSDTHEPRVSDRTTVSCSTLRVSFLHLSSRPQVRTISIVYGSCKRVHRYCLRQLQESPSVLFMAAAREPISFVYGSCKRAHRYCLRQLQESPSVLFTPAREPIGDVLLNPSLKCYCTRW